MLEIFQVRWFLAEKSPSLEIGSIYRNCRPSGISFAGKERVTDGAVGREIAQPPWSIHVGWKGGTVRWLTRWFSRFSRLQSPSPWGNFQIKLLNLKRETWAACCMWWQRRPSSMCSLVDFISTWTPLVFKYCPQSLSASPHRCCFYVFLNWLTS